VAEARKPVEPSKPVVEVPKPVEPLEVPKADETDEENEQCFRAGVQVPKKKIKQLLAFDRTEIDIHVNGDRVTVEIQIKDYEGRDDYDFEVCFWGTGHIEDEDREEVFKEMRRWLVREKLHVFWHKGLDTPKPAHQEVFMWFE